MATQTSQRPPVTDAVDAALTARPYLPSGGCALCGLKKTLVDSHIIPDFAQKRIRADAAGATFRAAGNVNRRRQQMLVMPLLCSGCEQILSADEKYFAEYIDKPFRDSTLTGFQVTDEIIRFMAGLALKILSTDRADGRAHGRSAVFHIEWARTLLREFLLGRIKHPGSVEHHLYFPAPYVGPRRGVNSVMRSYVVIALSESASELFTMASLGGYVAVTILNMNAIRRSGWDGGTRLTVPDILSIAGQTVNSAEFDGLVDDIATSDRAQNAKISPTQRSKILADHAKVQMTLEKKSKIFRPLLEDRENRKRFGQDDGDL